MPIRGLCCGGALGGRTLRGAAGAEIRGSRAIHSNTFVEAPTASTRPAGGRRAEGVMQGPGGKGMVARATAWGGTVGKGELVSLVFGARGRHAALALRSVADSRAYALRRGSLRCIFV